MGIPCTRMEKQEMARHFISNSYKFHPQIAILQLLRSSWVFDKSLKFVIKKIKKMETSVIMYSWYNFLSRCFKQHFGVTPSKYQKG